MKIRSEMDVRELDNKIKNELGIEVSSYRNEEIIENIGDLMVFPIYVIKWTIRPILFALFAFVLGFYLLDLVHVEFVLYAILGFILFMAVGALSGILLVTRKMRRDIAGVLQYSLNILESMVMDLNQVSNSLTKENRKEILGLLFTGILHIITIPVVSDLISNKIPLIGNLLSRFVRKILRNLSNRVSFSSEEIELSNDDGEDSSKILQLYVNSIQKANTGINGILTIVFKLARFPIKLAFSIVLSILLLLLYLIN